jgi:glyoxylase-like metal-dependent hydrolase (beta-lactamase superfamily II)
MRCSISRTLVRCSSSLDGWAWLPNEKILFTGDACVNGPYNYTGDGNIGDWIKTLEAVKKSRRKNRVPRPRPRRRRGTLGRSARLFHCAHRGS